MRVKHQKGKTIISIITTIAMVACLLPANLSVASAAEQRPADPVVTADDWMAAGVWTEWDCIEFGSYPQAEITAEDDIYAQLTALKESAWDENRNTVIDGITYHRMQQADAYYIPDMNKVPDSTNEYWYNWGEDETAWHYFQYEPIKWRVLDVDGDTAFIMSDMVLDARAYHDDRVDVTWEGSTVRSWLNGYGAESNDLAVDYTSDNFIDKAFSENEQAAIVTSDVENVNHIVYEYYLKTGQNGVTEDEITVSDTALGGNNTQDKIYFLSESEVYATDTAAAYGFSRFAKVDEGRWGFVTEYAAATGVLRDDNYKGGICGKWWLRSPGSDNTTADNINVNANVDYKGQNPTSKSAGVRPVLKVDLSSNEWKYAGTYESDEILDRQLIEDADIEVQSPMVYQGTALTPEVTVYYNGTELSDLYYTVAYSNNKSAGTGYVTVTGTGSAKGSQTVPFTILKNKQTITTGAKVYTKAYGNAAFSLNAKSKGARTYTSSNKKVATVNSAGKVTIKGTGKATITIKAKATANYKAATKTVTIKVAPKKVVGLKLSSPSKKKLTVKWTKDTRATGYQIVYAQNKNFTKGKKTVNVAGYKNVKKTISKLSSKRYYVKVRAYKTVSGEKIYGKYSAQKNIKVK